MDQIIPVIIIGAGISGVAASSILSKNGIKHIIIQSRDRIGGRTTSIDFHGDKIQLGAYLVHHPSQGNSIAQLIKEIQWPIVDGDLQKEQAFCEGVGSLSEQISNKGWVYYQQIFEKFKQLANKSEKDISVAEAAAKYVTSLKLEGIQKLIVEWALGFYGCVEAAQIHDLSAKQFTICMTHDDYIPVGGYDAIIEAIVKKYSPQILLNKRVTKIEYQSQIIKITTENGEVYQCQKLISSLPLGILKKKSVQFKPQLPEQYQIAIDKIGMGILNKIFISVSEPFWNIDKKTLTFYTQEKSHFANSRAKITQNQNILCLFISGESSIFLNQLSKEQLIRQLSLFFAKFNFQKEVIIQDLYLTSWHKDRDSLGSYSYSKVGTQRKHYATLRESIEKNYGLSVSIVIRSKMHVSTALIKLEYGQQNKYQKFITAND